MRASCLPPLLALLLGACAGPPAPVPPPDPLAGAEPAAKVQGSFRFTEGPVWAAAEGALYFTDIPADRIYRLVPPSPAAVFLEPSEQANGLALDGQGRLLLCQHRARRLVRLGPGLTQEVLADRLEGRRLNSPNDLAVGPDGAVWFTDPPYGLGDRPRELPGNHVFRLGPEGTLASVWTGGPETRPNGIEVAGGRLLVADTAAALVRAIALGPDGTPGAEEVFARTAPNPDGMTLDRGGNLYVAVRPGIQVFAPDGRELGLLPLPEAPTNCAFGDPDGRTLYVTARTSLYRLRLPAAP